MDGIELTERDVALFWAKVDKSAGPEKCWPWLGTRVGAGYGLFDRRRGGRRQARRSHRLAFLLSGGEITEAAPVVRHTCDNPPCCNPAHLIAGTQAQNIADMIERGRHWTTTRPGSIPRGDAHWSQRLPERIARGEMHSNAVLSAEAVAAIRDRYRAGGVTQRGLAREYGVSQGLIWKIVTDRIWRAA